MEIPTGPPKQQLLMVPNQLASLSLDRLGLGKVPQRSVSRQLVVLLHFTFCSVSLNCVSVCFLLCCCVSFSSISFDCISFRSLFSFFLLLRFGPFCFLLHPVVLCCFYRFRFLSFRVLLFRLLLFHSVPFNCVSSCFLSFPCASSLFVSFLFVSFCYLNKAV